MTLKLFLTLRVIFCILLTTNFALLSYIAYQYNKHDKQILNLEKETDAKVQLFNSASISQDSSGVIYRVMIPKSINNKSEIWLRLKFKSIKDLKEFQILN